ncbi:phospholipase C [Acetobacter fallax]|uniref:Phospholipase n=1 Tax=Acetobacter fallax TaxID=1737473 RepID=A0ABX0K9C0_9PROT|nr:alkaline phosphatase family protein [Acetobacter fallax]NHO32806.1 phospholipase [Acetobacter fallax]NHO36410.1 phospholipase [Acetobacter fallax]
MSLQSLRGDGEKERFCNVSVKRARLALSTLLSLSVFSPAISFASSSDFGYSSHNQSGQGDRYETKTPIRHLVVIYQENVSFDHYFATYPKATNPTGEPGFRAKSGTPSVNNLASADLLTQNPNSGSANGTGAALPFRLDRTQASTADQNHAYTAEQMAYDGGKADLFPLYTGNGSSGGVGAFGTKGQVLGYYDGNTVTAYWHYAQRYAMSDNAFTDTYGPSTPGALEVVSGQTNGMQIRFTTQSPSTKTTSSAYISDGQGGWTMINDIDPGYDTCSSSTNQAMMTSRNIGDLLNERGVTWGGFMGGFDLTATNEDGSTACKRQTYSTVVSENVADYIPHHNWFQYYESTSNPTHARPDSVRSIGYSYIPGTSKKEPANHEYDLNDFYKTVKAGNIPAVSFIKLPAYQDGHAGYSNPLDEQVGVVKVVNALQKSSEWRDTAVIIAYDDSDGWYDHAFVNPLHGSFDSSADQLDGAGKCGAGTAPKGVYGKAVNGRCGPGTRIPLIVISPWSKTNYVSHELITQASVVRFIEDNWLSGKRLGEGSFDSTTGKIDDMFDFRGQPNTESLLLDPDTGDIRAGQISGHNDDKGSSKHDDSPFGSGSNHASSNSGSSSQTSLQTLLAALWSYLQNYV